MHTKYRLQNTNKTYIHVVVSDELAPSCDFMTDRSMHLRPVCQNQNASFVRDCPQTTALRACYAGTFCLICATGAKSVIFVNARFMLIMCMQN